MEKSKKLNKRDEVQFRSKEEIDEMRQEARDMIKRLEKYFGKSIKII